MTNNKDAGNLHSQNRIQALHQSCSNWDTRRHGNLDNKYCGELLYKNEFTRNTILMEGYLMLLDRCYNNSWNGGGWVGKAALTFWASKKVGVDWSGLAHAIQVWSILSRHWD